MRSRVGVGLFPLAALLVAAGVSPQDPVPPPGGFPLREILDQVFTYADGYRTRVDLRLPDPAKVTPPPTGWPCLLHVHGLGSNRKNNADVGILYAKLGYVSINYDVRGQGDANRLNAAGGTTLVGELEKADMVELFFAAKRKLGRQMDFNRLAVRGGSQGGQHSWAAAAWSEHELPHPRGSITRFPKILAAAPDGSTPNLVEIASPEGNAFSGRGILKFFRDHPRIEPVFKRAGQRAFLTQDFAGWSRMLRDDPGRPDRIWIKTSKVAVFANNSWDDRNYNENTMVDLLNAMPKTTPRFVYLTTGNHGSPRNRLELAQRRDLEVRWFGHFLKGLTDEMVSQPRYLLAVSPDDATLHRRLASVWQLRQTASYPDTGAPLRTFYLRRGGLLSPTPPPAAEPPDRVRHRVAQGFGPKQWLRTQNQSAAIFRMIPLSSVAYRSAPLAADRELIGRTKVEVHIGSTAVNLQVNVALFDEDPAGQRRYVTGGFRSIRGRRPGISSYPVVLGGALYVFRAGHRLVLAVENETWHRPLGVDELRTAPYFETYSFDVLHSPASASRIDVPLEDLPGLGCRVGVLELSRSRAGRAPILLDAAPARAGEIFVVLVTLSGTVPGLDLSGRHLPINLDALSVLGLGLMPAPPFTGFLGRVDAGGRAAASFAPAAGLLPPSLGGRDLSFTAITLSAGGRVSAATAASRVKIVD